jgi:hypothetical protein
MADNQRIPYGDEKREELPNGTPLYIPRDSEKCHDCGAERGELHITGCDVEQCPMCGAQLISCDHAQQYLDADTDHSGTGTEPADNVDGGGDD